MAKTPAQLDREIAEALAENASRLAPSTKPNTRVGKTSRRTPSPNAGARVSKTKLIHVVQGNYGYGHGWEDLTAEDTRKEALVRLREYRANESAPFRLIRRREKIAAAAAGGPAHARKKKLDRAEAKRMLQADGIDFRSDFHTLSSHEKERILEVAKLAGYRVGSLKRKDAPGSTARMYFQALSRLNDHATRQQGNHTEACRCQRCALH